MTTVYSSHSKEVSHCSEALQLFRQDLESVCDKVVPCTDSVIDDLDLRSAVANSIDHMLSHNFNRLVNLMYRLDIDENRFNSIISTHYQSESAYLLADLVIEKEMQRIAFRLKYSDQ